MFVPQRAGLGSCYNWTQPCASNVTQGTCGDRPAAASAVKETCPDTVNWFWALAAGLGGLLVLKNMKGKK